MSFIKDLFHHKDKHQDQNVPPVTQSHSQSQNQNQAVDPNPPAYVPDPTPVVQRPPQQDAYGYGQGQPGQGQVYIPPPPRNNPVQQSNMQNIGMMGGAMMAHETGGSVGMGMVDGLMIGNFINQRVVQAQKHAYWREQALNYQAGLPAAGVGDDRLAPMPMSARERSRSRSRDERRRKRWERRAARRGGGSAEPDSSGSDSERDKK